ncbi:HAD family phosphatase [Virgibacillus sp. NKC19-3]|uniref:Cof-type HAD-IIB family hydrolase n=1 Tax=Virgibacillus saliphilus TaxID=2831674 RepID=UPI001C9A6B96|nr:Cof-type HAD-IIB family hydrolase [Virgibacillus sp. NKC19-3]MBY7144316.1 HAD family phosphatase [Virgibacillus sp. NKC19-3]
MTLIAIDLDGTLLSDEGFINDQNRKAIHEAQRQEHIIVISSGRSLHDSKQILTNAGLNCPIITGNGAVASHSGEIIQNLYLSANVVLEMIDVIEKSGLYYEIYTNKGVFIEGDRRDFLTREINRMKERITDFEWEKANGIVEKQYQQHGITYVPNYREIDYTALDVYKLFVLSFDVERLTQLQDHLMERNDIALTTSGRQKLEIGNPEASKGNALKFIANYFGVPMKDTVAIGDNRNDLSMFYEAGTSIAMENAEEVVKKQADHVTKHHNQDGVAFGLRKWVL